LIESSVAVWETWFGAWWAAHWSIDDLPGLRLVIRLYDRVTRGDVRRLGELRQLMDSYGITPKGQQDRRWLRPEPPVVRSRGHDQYASGSSAKERFRGIVGPDSEAVRRRRDTRDALRPRRDPRVILRTESRSDGLHD
jgi:hypothetical protein